MGFFLRLRVLVATIITIGAVGIVYARLKEPLISEAKSGGQFGGFLSNRVAQLDALIPVILSALLLGVVVWFVAATILSERTESREVRRP